MRGWLRQRLVPGRLWGSHVCFWERKVNTFISNHQNSSQFLTPDTHKSAWSASGTAAPTPTSPGCTPGWPRSSPGSSRSSGTRRTATARTEDCSQNVWCIEFEMQLYIFNHSTWIIQIRSQLYLDRFRPCNFVSCTTGDHTDSYTNFWFLTILPLALKCCTKYQNTGNAKSNVVPGTIRNGFGWKKSEHLHYVCNLRCLFLQKILIATSINRFWNLAHLIQLKSFWFGRIFYFI